MNSDKAFQDASHEYLVARQRMNEKVNRCKEIELKMQQTLREIQAAYLEKGENLAKTVGTLHLTIAEVAGDAVDNAVIKVFVEPESFPDFEEINEEDAEKKNQVAWTGEFPANFVFDAIQSREAIVRITIGEDDDDKEPIKEITFPIASLFREDMKKWFHLAEEATEAAAVEEPAAAQATVENVAAEEHVTEAGEPSSDKTEAVEAEGEAQDEQAAVEEAITTEAGETTEKEATTDEQVEEAAAAGEQEDNAQAASEEVVAEEAAPAQEAEVVEAEATEEVVTEEASASEETQEATTEVVAEDVVVVEETIDASTGKVHIHAAFVLSEIEALAQKAIALSKEKNDMDIEIRICDQELSSARIRYERLKASQKAALGSSASAMKSKLTLQRAPPKPKSLYERTTAAIGSTFTPQRRSLAWTVSFFVAVSVFFHTNGDELII